MADDAGFDERANRLDEAVQLALIDCRKEDGSIDLVAGLSVLSSAMCLLMDALHPEDRGRAVAEITKKFCAGAVQ